MATIQNDIVFVSKVEIPLEEYDRLRKIEHEFETYKLSPDGDYVILDDYNHWSLFKRRVITKDTCIKELAAQKKYLEEQLERLNKKQVPMFNMPGTKVRYLK